MNWIRFEQIRSTTSGLAGQALIINPSGTDFIFSYAPSGVSNVGALNGYLQTTYGATITGNVLYLHTASGEGPGLVSTGAQEFAGIKTFLNNASFSSNLSLTNSGTSNIGLTTAPAYAIYSHRLYSPSSLTVGTLNANTLSLSTNSLAKWQISSAGDMTPVSGSAYDLGSSTNRVAAIYSDVYDVETLTATTGNITTVNSTLVGSTTVDATYVQHSGGDMHIGTQTVNSLAFKTSGTLRWVVGPSDGEFRPMSTDRYDLGSTSYQIRNIYSNALLNNNTLSVGTSGANANVLFIANSLLKWTLNTGDDFYPAGSGSAYVGLSTNPLAGVYTQRCYSPGTINVGTVTSNNMNLMTNNAIRWQISGAGGALIPYTSDTFDVGSTSSQVRNIYTNAVLNNNTLSIGTSGSNTNLLFITNSTLRWTMNTGDDFYPNSNNAANLGAGNNSLATVYSTNVYDSSTSADMHIGTLHPNRVLYLMTASGNRWVLNTGGEFYPVTSGTDTIGVSSYPLGGLYTNAVYAPHVDLTVRTQTAGKKLLLGTEGSAKWVLSGSIFYPNANGYDLGTTTNKVGNLFTAYVGDATNPATTCYSNNVRSYAADLTLGTQAGSANNIWITVTGYNKWVFVGDYLRPQVNNVTYLGSSTYQLNQVWTQMHASQNSDLDLAPYANNSLGGAIWMGSTNTSNSYNEKWYIGPNGNLQCAWSDGQNNIGLTSTYRPDNAFIKTAVYVAGTKLNVPYTASHYYCFASGISAADGDCMVLVSGKIEPCITASATNCAGILTSYFIDGNEHPLSDLKDSLCVYYPSGTTIHEVATAGDSRVIDSISGAKVCNWGGDVYVGDLLVTAGVSGYLMKQHDDVIRSCTVAKLMESVSFSPEGTASGVYVYLYCS